jgi:hypothetical protein
MEQSDYLFSSQAEYAQGILGSPLTQENPSLCAPENKFKAGIFHGRHRIISQEDEKKGTSTCVGVTMALFPPSLSQETLRTEPKCCAGHHLLCQSPQLQQENMAVNLQIIVTHNSKHQDISKIITSDFSNVQAVENTKLSFFFCRSSSINTK